MHVSANPILSAPTGSADDRVKRLNNQFAVDAATFRVSVAQKLNHHDYRTRNERRTHMPILRKDGRNILFIHVPKTGGTTVEKVFQNSGYQTLYLDSKVGRGSVNSLRRCSPQHLHAEMLEQTFRIQAFDFLFLISRDPVARFKSEYVWRNRKKDFSVAEKEVERWGMKSFQQYATDPYIFDNHIRPQTDFYIPGAFIYRLEDGLDNIVGDLNNRFACDLAPEIPKLYDSKVRTGYSSKDVSLSKRMEQGIRELYQDDFKLFGYA